MGVSWSGMSQTALKCAGLGGISLLLSAMMAHAGMVEVKTSVSAVLYSGNIELALPANEMVSIGDKVEFEADASGEQTGQPDLAWTVKEVQGNKIVVEPSKVPLKMPKVGDGAAINTFANQPSALSSSEMKITAAEVNAAEPAAQQAPSPVTPLAPASANEQKPQEAPVKTEKVEAETEATQKPVEPVAQVEPAKETAQAATEKAAEPATEPDATSEVEKKEVEELPVQTPSEELEPSVPVTSAPEAAEQKQIEEPASESEQAAPVPAPTGTAAPKEDMAEPIEPKAETKSVELKAATKADAAVTQAKPATPAPETDCDRLAAHPFDPDAVAKGVFYADLNAEKVIEACQEAIASHPEEARFYTQLTRGFHKAGKRELAYSATLRGAELGSGQSMAYLGVMYKNGETVGKSQSEALSWFEKAAKNGNPGGMVFAASMYRDGVGTARNYKRAAELFAKASALKIAEASADLGIFYDRGHGVEQDPRKAAELILSAFAGDDKDTQKILFEAPGVLSEETRQEIQKILKEKGFYKSIIDADFGSGTRRALIMFKRNAQQ
nr:hypothetical protein [uncultured Cohaesibacter sp.]